MQLGFRVAVIFLYALVGLETIIGLAPFFFTLVGPLLFPRWVVSSLLSAGKNFGWLSASISSFCDIVPVSTL